MKTFTEIIIEYIKTDATYEEIKHIIAAAESIIHQTDNEFIKQAVEVYDKEKNLLTVFKYIKDRKGWSVSQAKSFLDQHVRKAIEGRPIKLD